MTELLSSPARESIAGFEIGAAGITPPSNPDRRGVFLDDVVVELGLADRETMDAAVQSAQQAEKAFERYVLESGVLDEKQLSRAVAERNGLDHIDLDQFPVDTGAAEMVTRSAAERYRAVPVAFAADGAVIVAVEDPFDSLGLSDIEAITRSEVRPAIAAASGIKALIEKLPEQPLPRSPVVVEEVEESTNPLRRYRTRGPSWSTWGSPRWRQRRSQRWSWSCSRIKSRQQRRNQSWKTRRS